MMNQKMSQMMMNYSKNLMMNEMNWIVMKNLMIQTNQMSSQMNLTMRIQKKMMMKMMKQNYWMIHWMMMMNQMNSTMKNLKMTRMKMTTPMTNLNCPSYLMMKDCCYCSTTIQAHQLPACTQPCHQLPCKGCRRQISDYASRGSQCHLHHHPDPPAILSLVRQEYGLQWLLWYPVPPMSRPTIHQHEEKATSY